MLQYCYWRPSYFAYWTEFHLNELKPNWARLFNRVYETAWIWNSKRYLRIRETYCSILGHANQLVENCNVGPLLTKSGELVLEVKSGELSVISVIKVNIKLLYPEEIKGRRGRHAPNTTCVRARSWNGDLVETASYTFAFVTASRPLHVCGAHLQSVCRNDFICSHKLKNVHENLIRAERHRFQLFMSLQSTYFFVWIWHLFKN